ncbi:PepSY domain-containing protein [Sphingomonas cannabina]|uniref:PepSY-associated TM helix domain-containing protein n=1 Tax=Sphingomonas cannabina TaxID=2899123 RepID=UPI001F1B055C|nr:PepSY domain-containing protein [Sphingomonas cannabina]UIJ44231.1 PepSY domain-containing protein [Sphingomonas cannabina]
MATLAVSRLYRAIWRWHFYAGLIVAPFLLVLAVTGTIYLFNDEINDAIYPEQRFVAAHATSVPVSRMIGAALAAHPGAATRIDLPATNDRAAVVFVTPTSGDPVRVSVDPGTGRVLGSFVYERTLVGLADTIHGSLAIGTIGDRIVELAACWGLVLIATGLYLWWPRGRKGLGGILFPRLWAKGRLFWRDLHAVTGVWTVALILFLILTGLPWAGVQGDVLKRAFSAVGIGYPASNRNYDPPKSIPMKAVLGEAPWTLEGAPMPASDPHAGHPGHDAMPAMAESHGPDLTDRVVAAVAGHGLHGGYRLFLPAGPTGVFTAYSYPDRPQGQRTLYFDRYSGRLIREIAYADYGWGAKAIELGVQLHMGNYFGRANQIVMLVPCIGIVLLVVSGVVMWWKRRPAGRLGAPPKVPEARLRGALAMLLVAGVLLPLFGASLVAVFALDWAAGMLAAPSRPMPEPG